MRILVAGGAGFIGTNLCDYLLGKGNEVIVIDNFYTSSISNIERFKSIDRYQFVFGDITKPLNIHTKLDQIYNLACPASPIHYQRNPIFTVKTNVVGTLNLLELAKETGARFLQASTSEVYGDPTVHPQPESYWGNVNPIGRRSCYDEGKRCAETLCVDFATQNNVDIRIARIFNTYGPYMQADDGRVVSNFIVSALKGNPITIYGDGHQTRSFQFISDLISGLTTLMNNNDIGILPVNLGNPEEFTMLELARKILFETRSNSGIIYKPLPQDDPKQRKPDISRAITQLKWKPVIKLDCGLEPTIDYFTKKLWLN